MKIHEYNQMMAYLTRPATPTETPDTRQQAASGGVIGEGGMFQGEDLGNRTGFADIKRGGNVIVKSDNALGRLAEQIYKAYAKDDINYILNKSSTNKIGTTVNDSANLSRLIRDPEGIQKLTEATKLDAEDIIDLLDDKEAYKALEGASERTTLAADTKLFKEKNFYNKAEKWLMTNAKRYDDPDKFKKAFKRTFPKDNLLLNQINKNNKQGDLSVQFSDNFKKEIFGSGEGNTIGGKSKRSINPFRSITSTTYSSSVLDDVFRTTIYNFNPKVRNQITNEFKKIIPKGASSQKELYEIRESINNNKLFKKFEINKNIKGPISRLIYKEMGSDLIEQISEYRKPRIGTAGLLRILKDKVDPRYRSMFTEALSAVESAQKKDIPLAKKKLKIADNIAFDHKIPQSFIRAGYADDINYAKLTPTLNTFNEKIKLPEYDRPMLALAKKYENATGPVKEKLMEEMQDLKNNFNKKHKNYLSSVSIDDVKGKPIFTSTDATLTKKNIPNLLDKAPKFKASMIPGLDSLIDSVSSMPDDFKAKRYWTAGLKGLGVFVGTPLVVYDGYKAIRDGLPPDEVVAKALLGADKLLYEGKEILQLTPEEKKARTLIQQTRMTKQIAEDFSDLDSDFETPAVDTNLSLKEAETKLKEGEDRYSNFRKGKDAQVAENRKTKFNNLKVLAEDILNPYANSETTYGFSEGGVVNIKDITKEYYNQGGRVGYADGPKDPSKRLFVKGLTALAAVPVLGKYFKLAKSPKVAAAVETVMEKVSGMPDWFQPFVNKVLKMGDDVTDTAATAEREIVKRVDIEDATVDVHYNSATNDVRVEVVGGKNAFGEPLEMQYKAPEIIEETGKKTKGEFRAAESRPVQTSPNDIELDGYETDMLDDLLSETDYLEGFGTGKIRSPAEIKKAKLRAKMREDAQRDPGSLLDDFDD